MAELEGALRDQPAWRAAWSLLCRECDPGDGWVAPLARLQALERNVAARLCTDERHGAMPLTHAAMTRILRRRRRRFGVVHGSRVPKILSPASPRPGMM
jgi:hypothetical protein